MLVAMCLGDIVTLLTPSLVPIQTWAEMDTSKTKTLLVPKVIFGILCPSIVAQWTYKRQISQRIKKAEGLIASNLP